MSTRTICLAAVGLALIPGAAGASCIPSSDRSRLKGADAVFTGRVVSVRAGGGSATFRVLSVRKGRVRRGATVRVHADPYPSSVTIGWRPRAGQRWRIYADRTGRRWTTNDCMGTRRL